VHEPLITVVGNVAGPPRQRTTPAGVAVSDFRIAATPRRLDRAANTWSDGETIWFGVTAWRGLAEHCADSLKKGDRVVVTGRLTTRSWDVEGGERRTGLEVDATSVGLDLSKGSAAYVKAPTLVTDQDPWVSSGLVDPLTGVVRPEELDVQEEDEHAAAA
jgi:single-strand DNA-binding protein